MASLSTGNSEKSLLLTLRWVSSAIVMFGHTYSIIFHRYVDSRWSASAGGVFEYLAHFRHGAVVIFFVMSGYLVGGGVLRNVDAFDFRRFFINRFSRIYIVLIPALLLTAGLDWTAYILAPESPIYTTSALTGTLGIGASVFSNYDFHRVLTTVLSLQSIIGEPMGSNRALWSLGIEWFFYFLFPAAIFLLARIRPREPHIAFIAMIVVTVALTLAGKRGLAGYWVIWTAGAFCSRVRLTGKISRYAPWIGGAVGALMFVTAPAVNFKGADLIIGFGFALLFTNEAALNWRLNRSLDKTLANFSYSLYVVHMPVLVFMVFLFFQMGLTGLDGHFLSWTGLGLFLAASGVELSVAYLFGQCFERRTDDLKRMLTQRTLLRRGVREQTELV